MPSGVRIAELRPEFARTKGDIMKKFLLTLLLLSSFTFVGTASIANAVTPAVGNPQVRIQIGQRRRRWRDRDRDRDRDYARGDRIGYGRTFTRDVQRGWRVY